MGRPRLHKDNAAKQKAYRERKAAAQQSFPDTQRPDLTERVMKQDEVIRQAEGVDKFLGR